MTDPQLGFWMLGLLAAAVALGFPIAFALLTLALAFGLAGLGEGVFPLMAQRVYGAMTTDTMIAVPLLLMLARIVERTSLLPRLYETMAGAMRAPPALAVVGACALLGLATGSAGAVVVVIGLPALLRAGYDPRVSSGLVCAAGGLGLLTPPSLVLVLYGASSGVPVPQLFLGVLVPAAILLLLYAGYATLTGPPLRAGARSVAEAVREGGGWPLLAAASPVVGLGLLMLGPYLAGRAALSEGAAMAALAGLVLAACDRSLTWTTVKECLFLTARTTARLAWLMAGAAAFITVFSYVGGQVALDNLLFAFDLSPAVLLVLAQLFIFALGWPLEWPEIVIVAVPLILPLLGGMGIDPLLFGVLLALNIQTSLLSPPVAAAPQLLARAVAGRIGIDQIYLGSMPFVGIVLLEMLLLYLWPDMALWLPGQFGR